MATPIHLLSITGTQAACAKKGHHECEEGGAWRNPSKQEGEISTNFNYWHESWTAEVNRKVGVLGHVKAVRIQLRFYHLLAVP